MKRFLVAAAVLALAACGGGGAAPAAPAPSEVPVQRAATPITVDAYGDSTMYGSTLGMPPPTSQNPVNEPVVAQGLLNGALGGGVTVVNNGVPGSFLMAVLNGGNAYYAESLPVRLSKSPARVVIGNYAINDSNVETPDTYRLLLNYFVDTIQQAGKIPVLEEPNPVCDYAHPNLDAFVVIMREVAAARSVRLVAQYDAIRALPNWQANLPDCVHPNADLYRFKAQREATQIVDIVQAAMH